MSAGGFQSQRIIPIASLNLEYQEYVHPPSGARHFHLAADDANNAFLVAFLTVPRDDTGVAHILEHTSLCGSEHYPVHDPFFMMLRRSLNTFMNAFTASDWTAYPFSSQNRQDFDNLLRVYLDAAFFPKLEPLDFAQEGHRLEFSEPSNPDSPLERKGVVYNEMKGAMSAPLSQIAQRLQSTLFPSTTYHFNSGGDPEAIPELTHEALRAFHARHYHPSNAVFMTYGSFPVSEHQEKIEELVLGRFRSRGAKAALGDERRYATPIEADGTYATDEETLERKSQVLLGWLLGNTTDLAETMRARLLAGVLLDNSASPLRQALETTDLGAAPSALSGLDDSTREATFCAGLEDCASEDAGRIERLVLSTLEEVESKGVPQSTVDAVLHQVELAQREITGGGFPYGLQLMVRALSPALYGGDPYFALDIDPALEKLREESADPDFVPGLVRRLLLDNRHRVRLTMRPDPTLAHQRLEKERRKLERLHAGLSGHDARAIIARSEALKHRQESEDDPEILPKVTIADVPEVRPIPRPSRKSAGRPLPVTIYTPATNGLTYVQLVTPLPALDAETLDLLPVFCDVVTDVGAGKRDYLEMQAWQAAVTGGVRSRTSLRSPPESLENPAAFLVLAGKGLARNRAPLVEVLEHIFFEARFDEHARLRELLAQSRLHAESQVVDSAHSLAMLAASAGTSPCAALEHRWGGLVGLETLKALDDDAKTSAGIEKLAAALERIRDAMAGSSPETLIVADPDEAELAFGELASSWPGPTSSGQAGSNGLAGFLDQFEHRNVQEAWLTNTQVNFCAHAYPAPPQASPDAPALRVLGVLLRNGYLHRAIREQGGAYGAGAGYSPDSGAFRFFSYRDPRLGQTLEDFHASVAWLIENPLPERLLEEALLGVVGEIDRPDSPAGEATIAYFGALHGRTPEARSAFRKAVLEVTVDDLCRVAEHYLAGVPSAAVVTSPDALSAEPALAGFEAHKI